MNRFQRLVVAHVYPLALVLAPQLWADELPKTPAAPVPRISELAERSEQAPARAAEWKAARRPNVRMAAEFEHQQSLCLSCGDSNDDPFHTQLIAQIARAVRGNLNVVVLICNDKQQLDIVRLLENQLDTLDNISFMPIPHDTKWIRDFGPTVVRQGSRSLAIDWQYKEGRPNDDLVPLLLSELSQWGLAPSPLTIEGGNLLCNGQGLGLTTRALLEKNEQGGISATEVRRQLRGQLGIRELVVLEPLVGELTGHVDMFATFTDANTVVVGQYDRKLDPDNAVILDRNAARLSRVRTPQGRLNVVRVPMGRNDDGVWRTYTNCIFANGVLLVPKYDDSDAAELNKVVTLYQRLLPGWQVVPVDTSRLIEDGGALHCISLNIP